LKSYNTGTFLVFPLLRTPKSSPPNSAAESAIIPSAGSKIEQTASGTQSKKKSNVVSRLFVLGIRHNAAVPALFLINNNPKSKEGWKTYKRPRPIITFLPCLIL
jgi:hypothetical protein